jgi:hypothetical protein
MTPCTRRGCGTSGLVRPFGPRLRLVLSRRLAELSSERQDRVIRLVDDLPSEIGLLDLRVLVPVIRRLDPGAQLNLLAAEALAAAHVIGATVLVATDAPMLSRACLASGLGYQLVAV